MLFRSKNVGDKEFGGYRYCCFHGLFSKDVGIKEWNGQIFGGCHRLLLNSVVTRVFVTVHSASDHCVPNGSYPQKERRNGLNRLHQIYHARGENGKPLYMWRARYICGVRVVYVARALYMWCPKREVLAGIAHYKERGRGE